MSAIDIVKADVKAHKWAYKHRKEIASTMNTAQNAIASKRTTIGGIGALVVLIGQGMVGYGDGTTDLIGWVSSIFGVLSLAYGMFNARDNNVTSAAAGAEAPKPGTGGYASLRAISLLILVCAIFIGCAGLGRRLEEAADRATIPVYAEDCAAELEMVKADIATSEAWITAAPSAKVVLQLNDDLYTKLLAEATENLEYKKQRAARLEAILPTLPAKPLAPAPGPQSRNVTFPDVSGKIIIPVQSGEPVSLDDLVDTTIPRIDASDIGPDLYIEGYNPDSPVLIFEISERELRQTIA